MVLVGSGAASCTSLGPQFAGVVGNDIKRYGEAVSGGNAGLLACKQRSRGVIRIRSGPDIVGRDGTPYKSGCGVDFIVVAVRTRASRGSTRPEFTNCADELKGNRQALVSVGVIPGLAGHEAVPESVGVISSSLHSFTATPVSVGSRGKDKSFDTGFIVEAKLVGIIVLGGCSIIENAVQLL